MEQMSVEMPSGAELRGFGVMTDGVSGFKHIILLALCHPVGFLFHTRFAWNYLSK